MHANDGGVQPLLGRVGTIGLSNEMTDGMHEFVRPYIC